MPAVVREGKQIFENGVPQKKHSSLHVVPRRTGTKQRSVSSLAGQHADYLVKQLLVFQRTDERPEGAVMKQIAHDLTAKNMQAVAAYLQAVDAK